MKKAVLIIFFVFWIFELPYAQKKNEKLPYRKITKYSGEINYGFVMARIIDDLGFNYYWASEGLGKENIVNEYGSTNVLYSLLENVAQISSVIVSLTLNQPLSDSIYIEKNLNELRRETLFNLKKTSEELYQTKDSTNLPLWGVLSIPISDISWYNEQIISYRRKKGFPSDKRIDGSNKLSQSKIFEDNIGADGLTNKQWAQISIMPISSVAKAFLMRKQSRINSSVLVEIKKQRAVYLEVGELENIKLKPNVVGGKEYLYLGNIPSQISLSISNDHDFINELIQWIVYINSGNEVGVDEIFRINEYRDINNELLYLNLKRYRNIEDKNGNSIRFEIFPESSIKNDLIRYNITRVLVNNSGSFTNQITFYGKNIKNAQFDEPQEMIIMHAKNIEGTLIDRIVQNIDYFRDYRNEAADPPLLNLND